MNGKCRIVIEPKSSPADRPLTVLKIDGLEPGCEVVLQARTRDEAGTAWASRGVFRAAGSGSVDVSQQAPSAGTFSAPDPSAILWSLRPGGDDVRPVPLFEKSTVAPLEVELSVESGGETLARERIERHFFPPAAGSVREPVDREGLFGVLFLPAGKGPHPALICLSGSGGGISEPRASLLASRGYAALALAYFGAGSLPAELREIPVEFIERGISWLGEHETVDSGRVGVCGISKGGELALLLGSLYPRIKAVAALSGSSFVWQAPGRGRVRSSWSYGGKPVPCLRMRVPLADILRLARGQAVAFRRSYERGLRAAADPDLAAIPVERVRGPVFLAAGTNDLVWPAAAFAEAVVERRRMHGCDCRYFRAEGAGHLVSLPYLPAAEVCRNLVFASANAETNALAAIGAWDAMIDFFDRVFKG